MDVALLTSFWLLSFWAILVRRDHFIPYDLLDQHYMFQQFIHDALRTGASPWWTPNIVGGYPIAADPLSALFYPPNLLMHLVFLRRDLLPYYAVEAQATLHVLWAALGTYFLARHLTGSRAGALLAALSWAFGAFFAWHTPHLSPISTLSWLPWIVLCFSRAARGRSPGWTALGAVAFGMMALAGHALVILQIGYLVAGITLVAVWLLWRRDRRAALTTALVGAAIVAVGGGLAAVQLLPSLRLSGLTERADFTYQAATIASYDPHLAVTLLLPNFFSASGPAPYWGAGDPAETNIYMGLMPVFLAGLAVVRARTQRVDRTIVFGLLAGAVVSLVLAFGSFAWPYRIAFDLLPGIDRVRRPGDFVALVQFALALLAAYGLKVMEERPGRMAATRRLAGWLGWALVAMLGASGLEAFALAASVDSAARQPLTAVLNGLIFAVVVTLAGWLVVRGRITRRVPLGAALALLVLITAIDLGSALAGKVYENDALPPNTYIGTDWAGEPSDGTVRFLLDQQRKSLPDRPRLYPEQTASVWANGTLVWGLDSASGYVVLCPRSYCALLHPAVADPGSVLFDLLGVRYYVTGKPIEQLHPGLPAGKFRLIDAGPPLIYENLRAFPRTWVASRAVVQPDDAALGYLTAHGGSLRDGVVLSEPAVSEPVPSARNSSSPGSAEVVRYQDTAVDVRASLTSPGYLVLADSYYPGWEATVDGQPAPIYRADVAFRAVPVPAGDHLVEFRFHLPGLRLGAAVSILAGVAVLALFAVALWFHRRAACRLKRSRT